MLGSQVRDARPERGGYSGAGRWVVALSGGSTAFVKVGLHDHTRDRLRAEADLYRQLQSDFTPQLLGFEDHPEHPVLVLEDLSDATWPPPWDRHQIDSVLSTLERVASSTLPEGLHSLEEYRESLSGWARVEQDPGPFLALGLVSAEWLQQALPLLESASERAVLKGGALVHFDVRSDNVAFLPDRTVLVDWSVAAVGNQLMDVVGWLPSLHVEGGPTPEQILGEEGTELVALVAGYWASTAGLPPPELAPRVREVQLAQLEVALPWAARRLDLPPPDTAWASMGDTGDP